MKIIQHKMNITTSIWRWCDSTCSLQGDVPTVHIHLQPRWRHLSEEVFIVFEYRPVSVPGLFGNESFWVQCNPCQCLHIKFKKILSIPSILYHTCHLTSVSSHSQPLIICKIWTPEERQRNKNCTELYEYSTLCGTWKRKLGQPRTDLTDILHINSKTKNVRLIVFKTFF